MSKNITLIILFFSIQYFGLAQTLTVSPLSQQVNATASKAEVTVSSNTWWGVYDYASWLRPDTNWYYGNKKLSVAVGENPFMKARTDEFVVYCINANGVYFSDVKVNISQQANTYGIKDTLLNFSANAGSSSLLSIKTAKEWTILQLPSWIKADVSAWKGSADVVLTADANPLTTTRQASFVVSLQTESGAYVNGIVKVQQQASAEGISTNEFVLEAAQGSLASLTIKKALAWTITDAPQWLMLSASSGSGSGSVAFIAMQNNSAYERVAQLKLSYADASVVYINVRQKAQAPSFVFNPTSVSFAAAENSTASVSVKSNTYWGLAYMPNWILNGSLYSFGDSSFVLSASQNPYTVARKAQFIAYYQSVQNEYLGGDTILVSQSASSMGVSDSVVSVAAAAGSSASVKVQTSNRWQISSMSSWLQTNSSSGNGNADISFTAQANPFSVVRRGYVVIRLQLSQSQFLYATVVVKQSAAASGISANFISFENTMSTESFSISSATSWNVSKLPTWLSASPMSGTGNGSVTLTALAHTGLFKRTDSILVSFSNGVSANITVQQSASDAFVRFLPSEIVLAAAEGSSVSVSAVSNTNWGLINMPDWLTNSDVFGYQNTTFELKASQNNTALGKIDSALLYWFDASNVYHSKYITLRQLANTTMLLQTFSFSAGWNLFSFNHQITNNSISDFLQPIISNVVVCKDEQSFFIPSAPIFLNSLKTVISGKGYLVYLKLPCSLYSSGMPLNISVADYVKGLKSGWNLAGYPFATDKTTGELFKNNSIRQIKNFDGFFDFESNTGSLSVLKPGEAYFIKK
ncbi:MAG: BACON domain-containing protein [Bacteroidales bacterium]|nr:BACON domain-containing protein [Bacteroidales bacterium]